MIGTDSGLPRSCPAAVESRAALQYFGGGNNQHHPSSPPGHLLRHPVGSRQLEATACSTNRLQVILDEYDTRRAAWVVQVHSSSALRNVLPDVSFSPTTACQRKSGIALDPSQSACIAAISRILLSAAAPKTGSRPMAPMLFFFSDVSLEELPARCSVSSAFPHSSPRLASAFLLHTRFMRASRREVEATDAHQSHGRPQVGIWPFCGPQHQMLLIAQDEHTHLGPLTIHDV